MKESSKNNFVFNKHMKKALSYAKIAYDKNEIPIGAVITKNGKIISYGYNMVESKKMYPCMRKLLRFPWPAKH